LPLFSLCQPFFHSQPFKGEFQYFAADTNGSKCTLCVLSPFAVHSLVEVAFAPHAYSNPEVVLNGRRVQRDCGNTVEVVQHLFHLLHWPEWIWLSSFLSQPGETAILGRRSLCIDDRDSCSVWIEVLQQLIPELSIVLLGMLEVVVRYRMNSFRLTDSVWHIANRYRTGVDESMKC